MEKLLITVPQATTSRASSPSRPHLDSRSVESLAKPSMPNKTHKTVNQSQTHSYEYSLAHRARPQKLQRLQPASALASRDGEAPAPPPPQKKNNNNKKLSDLKRAFLRPGMHALIAAEQAMIEGSRCRSARSRSKDSAHGQRERRPLATFTGLG